MQACVPYITIFAINVLSSGSPNLQVDLCWICYNHQSINWHIPIMQVANNKSRKKQVNASHLSLCLGDDTKIDYLNARMDAKVLL